jgi:predicted Fe-Mo cluster-binding NifX family protein
MSTEAWYRSVTVVALRRGMNLEGLKALTKVAVASEQELVAEHFGHCANFNIYETGDGRIKSCVTLANPGHSPGFLPNFLYEQGVNVVISGGMGGGAVRIFNEKGIEVITGASGKAGDAVEAFLKGALQSTGSTCHQHQHRHECGGE